MRMGLGSCHCAREEPADHWFRKTKFSRPDTGPLIARGGDLHEDRLESGKIVAFHRFEKKMYYFGGSGILKPI
jgi:hypothetical protein